MKTATIIALGIFCFSASVHAQPGYISATSIDSVVANSDHVFVGTIQKYEKIERGDEFGASHLRVWFEIAETLKGPNSLPFSGHVTTYPYVGFFHPFGQFEYFEQALAKVKKRGYQLFVAVGGDKPYAFVLQGNGSNVLTADFRLLADDDSVIRAAKEAISRVPANVKRIHTLTLWKPESIELELGEPLKLNVPVDERLEKLTKGLLESKSPGDRIGGLEAIRYFKTEENIASARKLLADPFKQKLWDTQTPGLKPYYSYAVRKAAWNTFRVWGITVDKPTLREDIEE